MRESNGRPPWGEEAPVDPARESRCMSTSM